MPKTYFSKMNIHQRIKASREAKGMSMEQLAKAVGVAWQTVQQWENGKTAPKRKRLEQVAFALGITVDYLLHGGDQGTETINQYHDVRGAMGHGVILQDQPGQITSWRVTAEWLAKNVPANTGKENLAIVTGFGDSMRGMYNSGDPLIVDTGIKSVEFDGVYFFRVGDDGFIKRLQRIPGNGIRVISKNTDYETWTITPDMDFEVFGRVLKVWKSEEF